jgi:hypothetical protein
MLWYRPGDTLHKEFTTSHPANGQATAADSLPVVVLAKNGTGDVAVTVSVTSIETGRYQASCVIPDTYAAGDQVTLRVEAIVAGVTGRGTLFETRLIAVDLTIAIATQLFVDGPANKLKVNSDHSINGQIVLGSDGIAAIVNAINESTLTANQIAAALTGVTSVILMGPLMTGETHKLVRGSAYLHSEATAPYVRVAKAMYDLTGASATFRMKLDRQSRISVSATIISYDANYYEVYADLTNTNTAVVCVGTGHDQFWVTLAGGQAVCISQNFLEVIEGILP